MVVTVSESVYPDDYNVVYVVVVNGNNAAASLHMATATTTILAATFAATPVTTRPTSATHATTPAATPAVAVIVSLKGRASRVVDDCYLCSILSQRLAPVGSNEYP